MALNNLNLATPTLITAPLLVLLFAVTLSWLPRAVPIVGSTFCFPQLPWRYLSAVPLRDSSRQRDGYLDGRSPAYCSSEGLAPAPACDAPCITAVVTAGTVLPRPASAALITGSVVVEQIFAMPGIGRYFVEGALNNDYTLVMGVVVVYSAFIASFNLLVDLTYAWLDPRLVMAQ